MAKHKINLYQLEEITDDLKLSFYEESNLKLDFSNLRKALHLLKEEVMVLIKTDVEVEISFNKYEYMFSSLIIEFPVAPFPNILKSNVLQGIIENSKIECFDVQKFVLELMSFDLFEFKNAYTDLDNVNLVFKCLSKVEEIFELDGLLNHCKDKTFNPYLNNIKSDFYELRYNRSYFSFCSFLNYSNFYQKEDPISIFNISIVDNNKSVRFKVLNEYIDLKFNEFFETDVSILQNFIFTGTEKLSLVNKDITTFKQSLILKKIELY